MCQPECDAFAQMTADHADEIGAEIFADDVAAKGQRQFSLFMPPNTEIEQQVQATFTERQLPFVNQQPEIDGAIEHRIFDFVERHEDRLKVRFEQSQREIGAGERTGHGDARPFDRIGTALHTTDDTRSVLVPHRCTVRQQRIVIRDVRERVDGHCGDFEFLTTCALIERLDVLQLVPVREPFGVDLALGERVKHECVVGVGAVCDGDGASRWHDEFVHLTFRRARASALSRSTCVT